MENPKKAPDDSSEVQALKAKLEGLLNRAMEGDAATLDLVKTLLASELGARLVEDFGDLAAKVERALVNAVAGQDLLTAEAVRIKLRQLRAELAEPEAKSLEKLLVQRVVLCWLDVHHADLCAARPAVGGVAQDRYYQQRQSQAQARYLAAVKALVTLRKLLQPSLSPLELATRPVQETAPSRPQGRLSGRQAAPAGKATSLAGPGEG